MNVNQLTAQILSILGGAVPGTSTPNLAWPDPPNEAVLSRVLAGVAIPAGIFDQDSVEPYAFLHVDNTRDHSEFPADLIDEQRWTLYIFAGNATDQSGGSAVTGGNRVTLGSSRGRGLLEVEPLVKGQLIRQLGTIARVRSESAQPVSPAGKQLGTYAERTIGIVATRLPSYPSFTQIDPIKGSVAGSTVTLTWGAAPTRYDLIGYTWCRASGSTAPTSPTGGTFVQGTGTTLTDTPGTGTWSYSVFWSFDVTIDPFKGTGIVPPTPNRWSSSETAFNGVLYLPASVAGLVVP